MIIGPTFANELRAAGLDPATLQFEGDPHIDAHLFTKLDPEQQAIFDAVAAAHDPTKPLAVEQITDRQFFQALAMTSQITQDEALAAVGTGAIPARMEDAIAALPANQQFSARMLVTGARVYHRHSPTVDMLRANLGWTDQQADDLWKLASSL